jgi:hypothetical protein
MSKRNRILKSTTSTIWQAIRAFMVGTDGTSGVALVELAIIAPVIAILIIGISDIGLFAFRQMEVQHAAQAGARYASKNYDPCYLLFSLPSYISSISSAVQNDETTFTISATPAPTSPFCASPTTTGLTNAGGTPSCPSTCTGGAGGYVTVSAQATYRPVLVTKILGSSSPFSASSYTITASATVRIQ